LAFEIAASPVPYEPKVMGELAVPDEGGERVWSE
jgi:hypothetical protein